MSPKPAAVTRLRLVINRVLFGESGYLIQRVCQTCVFPSVSTPVYRPVAKLLHETPWRIPCPPTSTPSATRATEKSVTSVDSQPCPSDPMLAAATRPVSGAVACQFAKHGFGRFSQSWPHRFSFHRRQVFSRISRRLRRECFPRIACRSVRRALGRFAASVDFRPSYI